MKLPLFWCCALTAFLATGAELPKVKHAFVVIAHRGDHEHAHENTLTAFRHAIEAGVDYVEIDVRRTADGQYILMHDGTVDRMTTGHGSVSKLTLAEVRSVRVRDLERPQIPPDTVPTFSETLKLCKGRINIYLDFKAGDRAVVAKMIEDSGMLDQVIVYDDAASAKDWHRLQPKLPLIVSPPDAVNDAKSLLDFAAREKIEILDGSWESYTKEQVQAGAKANIAVWPDIQDGNENEAYFQKVCALGFKGVQTDHPEELMAWLKSKNLR